MRRILALLSRHKTVRPPAASHGDYRTPVFERAQHAHEIELKVYLPGVEEDAVEVTIEDRDLVVEARRQIPPRSNFLPARLEEKLAAYHLRARLGAGILLDKARVEFTDGILRIILPTEQLARPWQVAVS